MKKLLSLIVLAACVVFCQSAVAQEATSKEPAVSKDLKSFSVYSDSRSSDNHYIPSGWMGDYGDLSMDDKYMSEPHSGSTCIKFVYTAGPLGMTQKGGLKGLIEAQARGRGLRWPGRLPSVRGARRGAVGDAGGGASGHALRLQPSQPFLPFLAGLAGAATALPCRMSSWCWTFLLSGSSTASR